MVLYTAENDDYFPQKYYLKSGISLSDSWMESLMQLINIDISSLYDSGDYAKTNMFCPSEQLSLPYYYKPNKISYGYNALFLIKAFESSGGTYGYGCKTRLIKFPSLLTVVGETGYIPYHKNTGPLIGYTRDDNGPARRHNNTCNIAFADGHVNAIETEVLLYQTSTSGKPINKYFGYSYKSIVHLTGQ